MILNFKRNRSAETDAKKRSKSSLLSGLPLLLAILLLCAVSSKAQLSLNDSIPLATGTIGIGISKIDSNIIGMSYAGRVKKKI